MQIGSTHLNRHNTQLNADCRVAINEVYVLALASLIGDLVHTCVVYCNAYHMLTIRAMDENYHLHFHHHHYISQCTGGRDESEMDGN